MSPVPCPAVCVSAGCADQACVAFSAFSACVYLAAIGAQLSDIDGLFVQQLLKVLDGAMFRRYIANHSARKKNAKEKTMNRFRLIAVGMMLMLAMTMTAQQAPPSAD